MPDQSPNALTDTTDAPSVSVRAARATDADALLALVDALADYEKLPRPEADARARLVRDGFETDPPRFFVLIAEDEETSAPVGYAIYLETYSSFLARPTLYIEDLFVLPQARGAGAGRALFAALASLAVERDCGRMEWVCLNWNTLAIGFYERRDAEHLDEWRSYRLTGDALRRAAVSPAESGSR